MIPVTEWQWFGTAGHFICTHYCRFHLCTKVGDYLVSTVGEMVYPESQREIMASSRGIVLVGRGDAREADYLKKCGYEPLGGWYEGCGWAKPVYETMVFRCGEPCADPACMCGLPKIDGQELDCRRCEIRGDAAKQHLELCHEYAGKVGGE